MFPYLGLGWHPWRNIFFGSQLWHFERSERACQHGSWPRGRRMIIIPEIYPEKHLYIFVQHLVFLVQSNTGTRRQTVCFMRFIKWKLSQKNNIITSHPNFCWPSWILRNMTNVVTNNPGPSQEKLVGMIDHLGDDSSSSSGKSVQFWEWVPMSLRPFVHGLGPGKTPVLLENQWWSWNWPLACRPLITAHLVPNNGGL